MKNSLSHFPNGIIVTGCLFPGIHQHPCISFVANVYIFIFKFNLIISESSLLDICLCVWIFVILRPTWRVTWSCSGRKKNHVAITGKIYVTIPSHNRDHKFSNYVEKCYGYTVIAYMQNNFMDHYVYIKSIIEKGTMWDGNNININQLTHYIIATTSRHPLLLVVVSSLVSNKP